MTLAAIDYNELPTVEGEAMGESVAHALAEGGFGADDTILHFHNHSLGKNMSWPGAIEVLAGRGYRLLLQIHDFAEDFRPTNYQRMAQSLHAEQPHDWRRRFILSRPTSTTQP